MMLALQSGLWAVHIADGILGWPWLAVGFVIAGVLTLLACWRVREEEIPRIAILTAAFFVASSIHVKLGPTSVHLLLGGLVGVVLGWRAPLAILIGVTLQALLIPHGGLTTIGVNASTQMLPALAAAFLFPPLHAATRQSSPLFRSLIVAGSALLWGGCLAAGIAVLATNPLSDLVRITSGAGLVVSVENLAPALRLILHPLTVGLVALFVIVCLVAERRVALAPEFPAGAFLGVLAVISTTLLTGLVLLADGAERWGTFVSLVFVAHLPLALLEGLILGMTVGFLAKVKPELLRLAPHRTGWQLVREEYKQDCLPCEEGVGETGFFPGVQRTTTLLLLVAATLLMCGGPVFAHALEAEGKIDKKNRKVTVTSYYETGDAPKGAKAKVVRADGSILIEGEVDEKGTFVFTYEKPEPLRVVITAPGGHRAHVRLSAQDLGAVEEAPQTSSPPPEPRSRGRDLVLGVTFLLALASFVMSWRNSRRLNALRRG